MAAATKPRRAGHRTRKADSADLHATRAETRRYMGEADASDPHRAAYEAGLANGERPGPEQPDTVHDAFNQGYAEHERRRAAKTAPSPRRPAPQQGGGATVVSSDMAHEGAGLLLGLVAAALVINYLELGWPGVTGWLSAKFLNKVTINSGTGISGTAGQGAVAGGQAAMQQLRVV
jgi:hypothetical protein